MKTTVRRRRTYAPYIFISPFYVLFAIFMIGPIIASVGFSFTEWDGLSLPKFIGFGNYVTMLGDPRFWTALKNTLFYVFLYNSMVIGLSLTSAILLTSPLVTGRNLFRSLFFLPVVMTIPVTALVFTLVYNRDIGLLNIAMKSVSLPSLDWLWDRNLTMSSITFMRVWRTTGYYSVIIWAGLQAIPRDLYEAARIDGAGALRRIWHITLPLLSPILLFVVVLSMTWSFQLFTEPFILTQGGPGDASLTLAIYMYQTGFRFLKLGYAATLADVLALIIFLTAAFQIRFFMKRTELLTGGRRI